MKKPKYKEGGQDIARLIIVQKMIAKGFSRASIRKHIERVWGVGRSQQYKIIAAAIRDLNEDNPEREEILAMNNHRLETIIEELFKDENWDSSLKAIDLINKMNGIYDKIKEEPQQDKVIRIQFGE